MVRLEFKVSQVSALLTRLLEEIEGGLLTTVENHAIAATFDDFLDHGAEYLKHGPEERGRGIAGIVFEGTIRRICRVPSLTENGAALDTLISELARRSPACPDRPDGDAGGDRTRINGVDSGSAICIIFWGTERLARLVVRLRSADAGR